MLRTGPSFFRLFFVEKRLRFYADFRLQMPIPAKPAPSSIKEAGSGTLTVPFVAKPVAQATSPQVAPDTKM